MSSFIFHTFISPSIRSHVSCYMFDVLFISAMQSYSTMLYLRAWPRLYSGGPLNLPTTKYLVQNLQPIEQKKKKIPAVILK